MENKKTIDRSEVLKKALEEIRRLKKEVAKKNHENHQ